MSDLHAALAEVFRVLKPRGLFLFLEHVAAYEQSTRLSWQRLLEPAWKHVAGNCHLTRSTEHAICGAGLQVEWIKRKSIRTVSIALIAILLYAALQSWTLAGLVLVNLLFAAVSGVAALWLRGLHLSVSASIGFIALFGVAVLNDLVLLSTIQRLRQRQRRRGAASARDGGHWRVGHVDAADPAGLADALSVDRRATRPTTQMSLRGRRPPFGDPFPTPIPASWWHWAKVLFEQRWLRRWR